jgi:hypothetical protein
VLDRAGELYRAPLLRSLRPVPMHHLASSVVERFGGDRLVLDGHRR